MNFESGTLGPESRVPKVQQAENFELGPGMLSSKIVRLKFADPGPRAELRKFKSGELWNSAFRARVQNFKLFEFSEFGPLGGS